MFNAVVGGAGGGSPARPTAAMIGTTTTSTTAATTTTTTVRNGTTNGHHHNNGDDGARRQQHQQRRPNDRRTLLPSAFVTVLRTVVLDAPLALVFGAFLLAFVVRTVHEDFYRPLFDRSRRTDLDLEEEFTYYSRTCNEYDLSTRNASDLLYDGKRSVQGSVDALLKHGGMVIPSVLKPESVRRLREWVVRRNRDITEEEVFPMSQGYNRLSYGIDPTEDPVIAESIQEITSNDHFAAVLKSVLGDVDPASSEITVITQFPMCENQVWHSDTKADGNALKFARTFTHSYSFFLPLQDTSSAMGATEIAPGTHYCANDIIQMCEQNRIGINEATPEKLWKAGDGALLNQHVWHRGAAHTDPNSPERILFIMSFLARPKYGNDPRQLSRGTYFHQKWNIWGHTLLDLRDPLLSMRKPFSVLRCLSLWKPPTRNWGYDLITATFMRFSNDQLETGDLADRFIPRLDQLKFPKWLRGIVLDENFGQKKAWEVFIRQTIDNTFDFMEALNLGAHSIYLALVLLAAVRARKRGARGAPVVFRALRRLMTSHLLLLLVALLALHRIRTSDWGTKVLSGQMLMRPFPPVSLKLSEQELAMISSGPTTFPYRNDVLFGTRYDAKFLGSYDRWLDNHPGNVRLAHAVKDAAMLYVTPGLDPALSRQLVHHVKTVVEEENSGRFLQQDFRTGDWRVMTDLEVRNAIHDELMATGIPSIGAVRKEIGYAIAEYRFGLRRGSAMARFGIIELANLQRSILGSISGPDYNETATARNPSVWRSSSKISLSLIGNKISTDSAKIAVPYYTRTGTPVDNRPQFAEGSEVLVHYDDGFFYPGTVAYADAANDRYDVVFDDGTSEQFISSHRIHKRVPVVEGGPVEGCYAPDLNDCYPGTVLRVTPSGIISIQYDDGEVEWRMP